MAPITMEISLNLFVFSSKMFLNGQINQIKNVNTINSFQRLYYALKLQSAIQKTTNHHLVIQLRNEAGKM